MNPNMCASSSSEYESINPSSVIEEALERLDSQRARLDNSIDALLSRLGPVLQPAEPSPLVEGSAKASLPESPVARHIRSTSNSLADLVRRLDDIASRLDT